MSNARSTSFWCYFHWLAFTGFALVLSEAATKLTFFQAIRAPWIDVAANYAVLGGFVTVTAVAVAAALTQAEGLSEGARYHFTRHIPHAVVFAVFVIAWISIWYTGLRTEFQLGVRLSLPMRVAAGTLVAVTGLALFKGRIRRWLFVSSRHLQVVVVVLSTASVLLSGYFVLQPLRRGTPAPVWIQAPEGGAPNVVIILLDTMRARDASLYGYRLPTTPHLEELARTWTVFDNAHSTGNGTPAVLPTLLTGRYYYLDEAYRYGELARAAEGWMSLPAILKAAKYENVYFGAVGSLFMPGRYHLNAPFDRILGGKPFPGRELILDRSVWLGIVGQMEVDYRAYTGLQSRTGADSAATSGPDTIDQRPEPMYVVAEKYLAEQSTRQPFFAVFHMFRPHFPFVADDLMGTFLPRAEGLTSSTSQASLLGANSATRTSSAIDRLRLRYDENILKADAQVGRLIQTLKDSGLYDQTMIVILADHGVSIAQEHVGAYSPQLPSSEHQIPLLVKYPWQKTGRRVRQVVSTVDIMPTVLDVVGARYPTDWVDGHSLRKAADREDRVVFTRQIGEGTGLDHPTLAAISGDLKLVERSGHQFLFNLSDDPDERRDLLPSTNADALRAALRQFAMRKAAVRAGQPVREAPALLDRLPAQVPLGSR